MTEATLLAAPEKSGKVYKNAKERDDECDQRVIRIMQGVIKEDED